MDSYGDIAGLLGGLDCVEDDYIDEYQYRDMNKKKPAGKGKKQQRKKAVVKEVVTEGLGAWKFRLPESREFLVHIGSHDMKYKEQNWIINERDIKYNIIPLTNRTSARAAAMRCLNTEEENRMAEMGITRWLDIRTYEEAVPYKATQLGMVRLEDGGNIVKYRIYFKNDAIDELKVKNTRLRELIESKVKEYVADMVML